MAGRKGRLTLAMAILIVGVGGGSSTASTARSGLGVRLIGTASQPTYVTQAPGYPRLVFVTEQSGRIVVFRNGRRMKHPFLSIRGRVSAADEQGLLSLAFDPHYRRNGRFYVDYTNRNCDPGTADNLGGCDIEIDGFRRSRHSAVRARPTSRRKVIEINHQPYDGEYGGQLQFGPGGHLFASVGYGGAYSDPQGNAQSKDSLLGKLLRLDPRLGGGYRVPRSNPFVGRPGRDEIYALGLRNPYRFSFDRSNRDLWLADVGQAASEEVDHVSQRHLAGANFGWSVFEGRHPCGACGFGPNTPKPPHYAGPVLTYPHSQGRCAIIGGYRVRNRKLRSIDGSYVYGDYCSSGIRAFNPASGKSRELLKSLMGPTSFGEGLGGSIYISSVLTGDVYKLTG